MIRLALLAAVVAVAIPTHALPADDVAVARQAFALADQGNWDDALVRARNAGPIAADVVQWERLRAGEGSFDEYLDFVSRNADWPGMALLRKAGEPKAKGAAPDAVRAYFAGMPPQTGTGSLILAQALAASGDPNAAADEIVRAWRTLSLTPAEQETFLAHYGSLLGEHHDGRMAAMLRAELVDDARRMLGLASSATRAVAEARIALQTDGNGIDALISAVPEKMKGSAGLAYDRFRWRIRKDRYDEAADLMLERSVSAESLGEPDRWADWRRTLARREMRLGDPQRAYRMAAGHHLTEGSEYADLEWLAGYIALRKLGDAETALAHFRRFRAAVNGPISLGRAGYWEGRALEALGQDAEARAAYALGAEFQVSYYGLLSAERIGAPFDRRLLGGERYPDWRKASFAGSSVFRAAALIEAAGDRKLALRFMLHLAEGLSGQDIGALAGFALNTGDANMALVLAKAAADKGVIWPEAYYPLNGMERLDLPVNRALALAIARRESEFDPAVVSPAGARGLMQVMPGTAKLVAGQLGLPYEAGRLTSDWQYNARLGSAYLSGLIEEFGASIVLIASGYNAGPGRPRKWIEDFGDPRSDRVDVVDWVEHIPFRETQTYVMRVSESRYIYGARLAREAGDVRFTPLLKGQ